MSVVYGQDSTVVNMLREAFLNFRYEKVIFMADSAIVSSGTLPEEDLLEIYRLKAVSHYSIGQLPYCELAFKSILQIDSAYVLDADINAPKIIRLFNVVKKSYKPIPDKNLYTAAMDSIWQKEYLAAAGRSIVFPGWGHSHLQQEGAGWFMAGSALLIPLSIYYTAASLHYERRYLDEIDAQKIKERFSKFDQVYQTRNMVLIVYLLYWAYAQYNLYSHNPANNDFQFVIQPARQNQDAFQLSIMISF